MEFCEKCGFILNAKPRVLDSDGICQACRNNEKKAQINYQERQKWLDEYIEKFRGKSEYECVVGVSGGKDSCAIVSRLIQNHGIKKLLLVHVCDEFTPSKAGLYNLDNLVKTYNIDLMNYRLSPQTFINETKKSFLENLHPLEWIEKQIYNKPFEVAKAFGIPLVFMGENPAFEYGESTELDIFHPLSNDEIKIIFLGAIYPYSNIDSLEVSKKIGFKTLSDFDDWQRQGSADDFTQIDSVGYMVHHWCKFIKFGFQRVSDLACRFVREGVLSKEQAMALIKEKDWVCDPFAKKDFCRTIGISIKEFNEVVDKFANKDILVKDINGNWRRKDLI